MSDFYTEQLIKKRTDGKDIMKKTVLIALTVISFISASYAPSGYYDRCGCVSVQKIGCGI